MKLKDKLAIEFYENNNDDFEMSLKEFVMAAYIAGFEKALELALMSKHGYEGPFISGSSIEYLKEKEEGDDFN